MFEFVWPFIDEISVAQAKMEAKIEEAKLKQQYINYLNTGKFENDNIRYCVECKFDSETLIDCPYHNQWLKQPCNQCPKNKEHKMTREEAFKKLEALNYDTKEGIDYYLKTFEALGLLKFDEPVKPSAEKGKYIFFPNPDGPNKINVSVLQSDAIETMRRYGYKVEHKSKPVEPIEPSPVEKGLTQVIGTYGYARVKQWLADHGYEIVKIKTDAQFAADAKEPNDKVIWNYMVPENIRVEKRSRGFVLWVDGELKWKSWEPKLDK